MSKRNRYIGHHNIKAKINCPHVDQDKLREFKKYVCKVLTIFNASTGVERTVAHTRKKVKVNNSSQTATDITANNSNLDGHRENLCSLLKLSDLESKMDHL